MPFKTLARVGPFQLQRIVREPDFVPPSGVPRPPRDIAGIRVLIPVWAACRPYYDIAHDESRGKRWQWFIIALTFARRDAPQIAVSLTWAWIPMGTGQ